MTDLPVYSPMLATRWPAPFTDPDWAFEVKWDGVRAIASWDGRMAWLRSRNGNDLGGTYPELVPGAGLPPVILDGEIVALDESGRPSFSLLQARGGRRRGGAEPAPVTFMTFDVLHRDGPLLDLPWDERRALLADLELPVPYVVADPILGDGEVLWKAITEQRLEGMVGKLRNSPYRPGVRSPDWRKVSRVEHVRAVVGGYLRGERSRAATFGSLLLGLVDGARLRYIGSVGTGFTREDLRVIHAALEEMTIPDSPFHPEERIVGEVVYTNPELVALVEFKEWTRANRLRAPAFKGFTDDPWESITWSSEGPPPPRTESG